MAEALGVSVEDLLIVGDEKPVSGLLVLGDVGGDPIDDLLLLTTGEF